MRSKNTTYILILGVLIWAFASCKNSKSDPLPIGWETHQIKAACAKLPHSEPICTHILAWKIVEDLQTKLYIEECLVWHHQVSRKKHWWWISAVYRHPRLSPPKPEWRQSMVFDSPNPNFQTYDHAPTSVEIENGVYDINGFFSSRSGYKILDAGVCQNTWVAVTGQSPSTHFDGKEFKNR